MSKIYHVGIDLGTSNSSLAYISSQEQNTSVVQLDVSQKDSLHTSISSKLLPSFLYAPLAAELEQSQLWVPGLFAKKQSTQIPDRVVSSAKSWLAHPVLSAKDPLLPWDSSCERKISPIEASACYLTSLLESLKTQLEENDGLQTIITIPASFDEKAKKETLLAAEAAGLKGPALLEEPQAACYAWLAEHKDNWRQLIAPKDVLLVCDIGGGTTDFSLIAVDEKNGELVLERISVGPHLLLGGDNMDLALAYFLKDKIEGSGQILDHWQFLNLIGASRQAKEELLMKGVGSSFPIHLSSKGSNLFASHIKTTLSFEEVEQVLLEGFFPTTDFSLEKTEQQLASYKQKHAPLSELGLDYENNPSITDHLFGFLVSARASVEHDSKLKELTASALSFSQSGVLAPTKILFNGGVFHPALLRERIRKILSSCTISGSDVTELPSVDLDLAVSKGAAYYSFVSHTGKGLRIRAASPRSYYLEIASSKLAIPGVKKTTSAICIIPKGTEESTLMLVSDRTFSLMLGTTAQFRFFASLSKFADTLGQLVSDPEKHLEESMVLSAFLDQEGLSTEASFVRVMIEAQISQTGILSVFMKHQGSDKKWELSLDLSAASQGSF